MSHAWIHVGLTASCGMAGGAQVARRQPDAVLALWLVPGLRSLADTREVGGTGGLRGLGPWAGLPSRTTPAAQMRSYPWSGC
jgi:hypothetical protein